MGGAATAAPIDSIGATLGTRPHRRPAEFGNRDRLGIAAADGAAVVVDRAGALGGGFPPIEFSGSTGGEPGVSPIPSMAWVHKCADSRWTYGLGMFGIAGFSVNYPASLTNPVLLPQNNQPGGVGGLGHVFTDAQFFQIVPTVSYALTDKLSVGFGPTITLGRLMADPLSSRRARRRRRQRRSDLSRRLRHSL